jgi:CRP-like cAMP-binding protein
MSEGNLGKQYPAGEIIIHQGDVGNYMYVIQEGLVEVFRQEKGQEILLAELKEGDMIGEMAIFENEVRSASVRAKTDARLLTVDKKNFLRRIHNDPSLAYKLVQKLSRRIREMNEEVVRLRGQSE